MRLRWTLAAAADLEHISDYLQEHHPSFAQSTVRKLYEGIRSLKTMPHRGRAGREEGTRELVLTPMPYIVAYRVREQSVEVLHIYHTARERS